MGVAKATFHFTFAGVDPDLTLQTVLSVFSRVLIKTRSMEVRVVYFGQPRVSRTFMVERSIHPEAGWGKAPCHYDLLPGEELRDEIGMTVLNGSGSWLKVEDDLPAVLNKIRAFREESGFGLENRTTLFVVFRGLTRASYINALGQLEDGWFLQEKHTTYDVFVPLAEVIYHCAGVPKNECGISIGTRSHIWSSFSSKFDIREKAWIPKSDARPAMRNAEILCETISEVLAKSPNGQVEWVLDSSRTPNLAGFAKSALEKWLGKPSVRRKIEEIRDELR
ncbi:MAG: hypothetical protein ACJ8FY_03020 [Gemmataceae bacterium]